MRLLSNSPGPILYLARKAKAMKLARPVDLVAGGQRLGLAHRELVKRTIMTAAHDLFHDAQQVVSASYRRNPEHVVSEQIISALLSRN
jgi:hypothetical protein